MDFTGLYQVAVLALATAAISVTMSKAQVFASFRKWIASRSSWLGELFSCYYCTSHWVAIALIAAYRPVVIRMWAPADLVVSLFVVVAIAAAAGGAIIRLTPFQQPMADGEFDKRVREIREALQAARKRIIEQDDLIRRLQG